MPTFISSEIPSSERAFSSGAAIQAVTTGSDEVIRSAISEETDSYQAIPCKQDQLPLGGNTPESTQSKMVSRCAERVLCRKKSDAAVVPLKKERKKEKKRKRNSYKYS